MRRVAHLTITHHRLILVLFGLLTVLGGLLTLVVPINWLFRI